MSSSNRPGMISTCAAYSLEMKMAPGYWPPKTKKLRYVPTTGTESMIPSAIRRPVPDSRSSGSE
jgi:hypothetical protein